MNKINHLMQLGFLSGVIGIIAEYFGSIHVSYAVLLVLVAIDTLTGIMKALRFSRFSSNGFKRFFTKVILYSISILTVRLLEIGLDSFFDTTLLSQITAAMLAISEAISILENLTLLGVPLPSNFIRKLFGGLVLPIVGRVADNTSDIEKYLNEIDDIIRYNLPLFTDDCIKRLLVIKFDVWKKIAMQINNVLKEKDSKNNDLMYYKIKVLIQNGFKEMENRWEADKISQECIDKFSRGHQKKVDEWKKKVSGICYSQEISNQQKKEQLIESIVVILYQTIIDARKSVQ